MSELSWTDVVGRNSIKVYSSSDRELKFTVVFPAYPIKLEFGNKYFTLLFCGVRQRNVPEVITHVQTIALVMKPYRFGVY